jgi:pilus assembly protein Flp/PilA
MGVVMRLITDEQGADLVEYALLAGLVALAAIAGVDGVGATMRSLWEDLNTSIGQAMP